MRVVLLQTTKWRSRLQRTKLTACSFTFESFVTLLPLNGLHLVWCMKVSTQCAVTKEMGSNIRRHLKTHLIGCHGGRGFDSEARNVTRRSWTSGPTLVKAQDDCFVQMTQRDSRRTWFVRPCPCAASPRVLSWCPMTASVVVGLPWSTKNHQTFERLWLTLGQNMLWSNCTENHNESVRC